jgi:beta-lactamase superfamily II metal-dependent hydrolase
MTKKLTALAALVLFLLSQRPHAQGSVPQARIYFVDVGTGASTLMVSPTGKTLLVDGGPPGGGTKVAALLTTLGIPAIDYTVVTHYHIDHVSGVTELLTAGRVAGTAFDNGDDASVQPPGTATSSNSTRGTYLNFVAATGRPGVTRATIQPGQVIDLGGGMRATCIVAGGRLLSGGAAAITNQDLNTESISLLVEYNAFDYLVSGDLTGGGSTSTAKTPDVETYVGQMVGDVDVVQLNHHGSTTTSNQAFLSAMKAEVAVAQTGEANTFGHPNRETVNKYLNTPTTTGNSFAGTGVSTAVGTGPVFYQNEASPAGDDRVTQQGYTAAAAGHAGQGTLLLATDGTTGYSLASFDDSGARISAALHTYPVDGVSPGVTTDFRPTVIPRTSPVLPLATEAVTVSAAVNDRESPVSSVTLSYAVNGAAQEPIAMALAGGAYQATIPAQPDGVRVDYAITAAAGGQTTTSASGYFSGVTPIAPVRALNAKGEPLYAGYAARIRGTVTASGFSPGTNDDCVQDATGAVNVYRSTDTPTVFTPTAPGQTVEAFGRIGFLGGRLRLDLTESVEKSSSAYGVTVLSPGPAPSPVATTIAALAGNPESFEGQFVSIANLSIVSGTIPATPQAIDAFVTVSDGTGTFSLKIDDDTDIEGFTPAAPFTAAGIIQQDDFLRPFDAGYDITPRSRVDLGAAAPAPAPLLTIAEARVDAINNGDGTAGADFVPDRINQAVRIQGTVTSIDFRGGNGIEYYIQDGPAGIDLFSTSLNAGPFVFGDLVEATGTVTQFNGLTEVTVTAMTLLTHGAAPAPRIVTLAQLGDGGAGEAFEAQLVTVDNLHIVSGAFPAANASGNVTVSDGTANLVLRVDSDTDIDGTPTPAGTFSVTALVGQFDVAPFDSGYQLLPRGLADIAAAAPTLTATPAAVAFGSVIVGSAATQSVTITNTNPFGVTLAPLAVTGADAAEFSAGAPGATTLAGGASTTASVTFVPASPGAKSATLNITSDGGSAVVGLGGTGQAETAPGTALVISEFRTRGAAGGNDEFIELYNNSEAPIAIGGYKLRGSNAAGTISDRATVLAGTILPARGHFLFANGAAAPALVALANQTYGTGITDDGGIAITLPDNTILDQVGMSAAAAAAFREGTPLAPVLANTGNLSYERKAGGLEGSQVDTNNNASDFKSGASDPQNLASPVTPGISASPTALNFGALAIGLTTTATVTLTNHTPAPVTLTLPFAISGPDPSALGGFAR